MSRLPRLSALIFILLSGCFLPGGTAVFADGPLAIHSPPLLIPPETAGVGIAPEVAVKLAIDVRGKVTSVQVISITPASEYDAQFRQQVIDTLSQWRFTPATKDGHAVESSLDWRVRFPASTIQQQMGIAVTAPLVGGDAEQRRAAVMAMPQELRRKLLEAQTRAAIGFLDAKRTHEVASPRFVVRSDADETVAKTVAGNLEAIFNVLAIELMPGISLQAEPYKVQVVAFRTAAQYEAFSAGQIQLENSAGFYSAAGLIVFHLEQPTSDAATSLLLHEATHAFLDRHVVRPGVAMPRWLGEGFADYVGNSEIKNGRLQPGKTIKRKYGFERGRVQRFETSAGERLDDAKQALRRGEGLGLQQMLEASPEIFYGARARLYYASSWLLVHYMRDGGAGWSTSRFPQLLLYLAEGYPQTAAVRTVYGDTGAAEQAFRQYVKSF